MKISLGPPVKGAVLTPTRFTAGIQNASFTKLRELTFAYDIPERFAQQLRASRASIAISGHNLHTWTKYKGLEPEATFLGGTRGGFFSWEQTTLPQLTQWTASLSLTL